MAILSYLYIFGFHRLNIYVKELEREGKRWGNVKLISGYYQLPSYLESKQINSILISPDLYSKGWTVFIFCSFLFSQGLLPASTVCSCPQAPGFSISWKISLKSVFSQYCKCYPALISPWSATVFFHLMFVASYMDEFRYYQPSD